MRRRKRSLASFSRTYASDASNLHRVLLKASRAHPIIPEQDGVDLPKRAAEDLTRLLDSQEEDFDKAWVFYLAAGQPSYFRSSLLACLSRSTHSVDQDRAWQVFEGIAPESRSADDFHHITMSQLRSEQPLKLNSICEEAAARGYADSCCASSFAYYMKKRDWTNALFIWSLGSRPKTQRNRLELQPILSRLRPSILPDDALELGGFLTNHPRDPTAINLAQYLLEYICLSPPLLENTSMETLLRLLRTYRELDLLMAEHYFNIIRIVQSSKTRSAFVRSTVFYRHLRWQMPEETPPLSLFHRQITTLVSFGITDGVRYFLDELACFHKKPTIEAYKQALIGYSRAGDVPQAEFVFDRYLADYGQPEGIGLVTPLLYVYARTGNVHETHKLFRAMQHHFGLSLNTVCWNILLKAYLVTEDPAGALKVFSQMLQMRFRPSSHTFGSLMGICANRGDIQNTHWLLKEAQRRRVKITMPMLDTVVQAYCLNGRLDLAEKFALASLESKAEGSPMRMWNTLLFQHAWRMDLDSFGRVRRHMAEAGLSPDSMTYAAGMLSLVLMNKPHEARSRLRSLHKQRKVHATEFHYAIILYGFLRSRNRDMVHIISREIAQRFNRFGTQSSLLILMSQVERELRVAKDENLSTHGAAFRLKKAEQFLSQAIANFHSSSVATKPSARSVPGESLEDAFSTLHYEYLIKQYGQEGAIEQARQLFQKYIDSRPSPGPSGNDYESVSVGIVHAMMVVHLKAEEYQKVEECWQILFSKAFKFASRLNFDEVVDSRLLKPQTSLASDFAAAPPDSPLSEFAADIKAGSVDLSPDLVDSPQNPEILHSKRFFLSKALSIYMRALAYQNKTEEIFQVVAEVEAAGFSMTTFNWSTYVQMLASSDRHTDLVEAFRVFEDKFMPRFPGWGPIKHGFALKPENVPSQLHRLEHPKTYWRSIANQRHNFLGKAARRRWSYIEPDLLSPTYVTTVYLAAALDRVRDQSILIDNIELAMLYDAAPKTIEALGQMPYWREKYQGVLIRGRALRPDQKGFPFYDPVAPGGVLEVGTAPRDRKQLDEDKPPEGQEVANLESNANREAAQPLAALSAPDPDGSPTDDRVAPDGVLGAGTDPEREIDEYQPPEDSQSAKLDSSIDSEATQTSADFFRLDSLNEAWHASLAPEDLLDFEQNILFHRRLKKEREARRRKVKMRKRHDALYETGKVKKFRRPTRPGEVDEHRDASEPDDQNRHEEPGEVASEEEEPREGDEHSEHDVGHQPEVERVEDAEAPASPTEKMN